MITITKERLLTIKQWRETYGPGSNVVLPAEEAEELARIALASLEAKPIGAFHIAEQQVDGTSDYLKDGEWPIDNGTIEVYATPPAPDVPAVLERLRSIVADPRALPRRKEWVSGQQYSYVLLENVEAMVDEACRAAMLHGTEPVSQTYKLNELSGNSPVTPDGWVMVPKKLTAENGAKGVLSGEFSETTFISCPECFGDDDCDTCDGSGRIEIKVPVTWTTIKSIWDKGIAHFAAKPPQEVNRG
ncbi:DUF550 domain-containing protein [Escherichia coli]|nr:DUF550 domain-containing protein [Escherichia coli]EHM3110019.1 DUF550 domain-containing protein [Escherichia coli]